MIAKSPTTHSSISGAHVLFNEDGSAQVMVGASEIGQGMCVVLSQIAAEELGISVEAVGITCADTGATPYDRGTFSSRVTFYTGMAVKKAAEDAKRQLFEIGVQDVGNSGKRLGGGGPACCVDATAASVAQFDGRFWSTLTTA